MESEAKYFVYNRLSHRRQWFSTEEEYLTYCRLWQPSDLITRVINREEGTAV